MYTVDKSNDLENLKISKERISIATRGKNATELL